MEQLKTGLLKGSQGLTAVKDRGYARWFFLLLALSVLVTPLHASQPQGLGHNIEKRKEIVFEGLFHPFKMIFENGDLLVTADSGLYRYRPSGDLSTIAELPPGPPGSVTPYGADYMVIDNPNGRLVRVTRDGEVATVATGLGLPDVAVQEGDHFIAIDIATPVDDMVGPARLLKVTLDGVVTPVATEGLGGPAGLYIDEEGYWVTDFILGRLLFVTREGEVTVIAEGLGQPLDIAFDGHGFVIADFANGFAQGEDQGRILYVTKSGKVRVIADRGTVGNPGGILLRGPDIYYTDVVKGQVVVLRGPRFPSKRVKHHEK